MPTRPGAGTNRIIRVAALPGERSKGILAIGPIRLRCALGRGGITRRKREGDGGTPAGPLRIVAVLYRPDRVARPRTRLPVRALRRDDGWCDAAGDRSYNRPVRLPYAASHEKMWRDDHLYDVVVVLSWNLVRPRPGHGSAIFLHVARPGLLPTEGCVAVPDRALRRILALLRPGSVVSVR